MVSKSVKAGKSKRAFQSRRDAIAMDKPFACVGWDCKYRGKSVEDVEKHARRQDKNFPFPDEVPNYHGYEESILR